MTENNFLPSFEQLVRYRESFRTRNLIDKRICEHLDMTFHVSDSIACVTCCTCQTRAPLHLDEKYTFTTYTARQDIMHQVLEEQEEQNIQHGRMDKKTFSLANPAEVWTQPSDKILVVLPPDWTEDEKKENQDNLS